MVDRAAALTQTRVMFVPTLYWVDDSFTYRKSVNSQVRHLAAGVVTCFLPVVGGHELCLGAPLRAAGALRISPSHPREQRAAASL